MNLKRHAPEVRQFMSHLPVEAERCEMAQQAWDAMEEHKIHHLPIMSGSHLRGVLTRVELLEAKLKLREQFADSPVERFCSPDPLVVGPLEPIDEVVRKMHQADSDCAVVMDGGFVVGLFTTTDLLRFVADFFGHR